MKATCGSTPEHSVLPSSSAWHCAKQGLPGSAQEVGLPTLPGREALQTMLKVALSLRGCLRSALWCRHTPMCTTPQLWAWSPCAPRWGAPAVTAGVVLGTPWGCTLWALVRPPQSQACELSLTPLTSNHCNCTQATFGSAPKLPMVVEKMSPHHPGFPPASSLQLLETAVMQNPGWGKGHPSLPLPANWGTAACFSPAELSLLRLEKLLKWPCPAHIPAQVPHSQWRQWLKDLHQLKVLRHVSWKPIYFYSRTY